MALSRPEEAEAEPKGKLLQIRLGLEAQAVIKKAAEHRGMAMAHYARQVLLRAALRDLATS